MGLISGEACLKQPQTAFCVVLWGDAVRCVFQAARRAAAILRARVEPGLGPGQGRGRARWALPRPLPPAPVRTLAPPRSLATLCVDQNVILYSLSSQLNSFVL